MEDGSVHAVKVLMMVLMLLPVATTSKMFCSHEFAAAVVRACITRRSLDTDPSTSLHGDAATTVSDEPLNVDDYKFLSRLDALLDMLQTTDVPQERDAQQASDVLRRASDGRRRRRNTSHIYTLRQFLFKCCRQGICDGTDFC